jgi:hypothetical protein
VEIDLGLAVTTNWQRKDMPADRRFMKELQMQWSFICVDRLGSHDRLAKEGHAREHDHSIKYSNSIVFIAYQ